MKKGRHRRFEEARALKRANDNLDALLDREDAEPCIECDALPGHDHASWCRATEEEESSSASSSESSEERDDRRPRAPRRPLGNGNTNTNDDDDDRE